ncbi:MAG: ABC transporter substrate-binding protein [Acidimicrobiia bacterium]
MRTRAVALVLVVLAACGGNGADAPQTAQEAVPLPENQQTLTVATPGDVYITRDRIFLGIWPDNAGVCETLVGLGYDFQPTPVLATRWTYRGDNTFRFELRRDVRFHNGAPLNAEAVRYSINRVVEKRQTLNTFIGPESTRVVDEYTVDITPTQPNLRLPEQIAHPFFSVVATGTDPAERPVCTGPFTFGSYSPNDRLVVNRNDAYWGEDKAKLRQITFRFIPDQNTRRLALESGEVDLVWFLAPQQTADVRARPGLQVAPAPPGAVVDISLNLHGEGQYTLLQDIEVRRALALSLDPRALGQQQWQGNAQPVAGVSPPAVLGTAASTVRPHLTDVGQARRILDSRGWREGSDGIREKDGRKLSLVGTAQFDFEPESLQFLQAQAKRVGIDLRLQRAPDAAAYSATINSGEWDVDVNYYNQNDANPVRIPAQFWYSKVNNARVRLTNPGAKFDALVDEALAATDLLTAQRKAAEAINVLVNEEAAAIALTNFPQIYAHKTSVAGFSPHPSVNHQPWTAVFRTGTT